MEDGRVLGPFGGFRPAEAEDTVELVSMWVHPDARGRGVGRMLVEAVIEWAEAAAVMQVALWVTNGNDSAIALYTKTGFVPDRKTKAHRAHPG